MAVGVTHSSGKQKPIAPRLSQQNEALGSVRKKSKAMVAGGGFCSAASPHMNLPFVHWTKARADGGKASYGINVVFFLFPNRTDCDCTDRQHEMGIVHLIIE